MKLPVNYNKTHWKDRKKVREEYIRIQNGNCHYCGCSLDGEPSKEAKSKTLNLRLFPKGFLNHPVHLHHSHVTGMTIGAVHAHCNGVLWQYEGE